MPKELEKIRKDIMANNPKMSKDMAYALATNIMKKRHGLKTHKNKKQVAASKGYKSFEATEPRDVESRESFAEKVSEMRKSK